MEGHGKQCALLCYLLHALVYIHSFPHSLFWTNCNAAILNAWTTMQAYQENFKAAVLASERELLSTLGFNFRIDTPHKCLFHPKGAAHQMAEAIERACESAKVKLHPQQVQQAAYDLCNEW